MNRFLLLLLATAMVVAMTGCSGDDKPSAPAKPEGTSTTAWDDAGYWRSTVDATSQTTPTYFSFASKDTIPASGVPKPAADVWNIAFRRYNVQLNGGASTNNGGDVVAINLGPVVFADVVRGDSVGHTWAADSISLGINDWYEYNVNTHQLDPTRHVYSLKDASGHHYAKFRVDSMKYGGMPPDMGTVFFTYYYQDTTDNRHLAGALLVDSVVVESGTGYYDFSSGSQVTPANPSNSADWDLAFTNYEIHQNSGPHGTGGSQAFPAYEELLNESLDPTDVSLWLEQPIGPPMWPDAFGSVLTEWYNYANEELTSKNEVYLLRTGGKYYKVLIEDYYRPVTGASANPSFIWNEI